MKSENTQLQEGRNLPVPHCIKGTQGRNLHPKIADVLEGAAIIDKPAFGSTELAHRLVRIAQENEPDITLVELCTDEWLYHQPMANNTVTCRPVERIAVVDAEAI